MLTSYITALGKWMSKTFLHSEGRWFYIIMLKCHVIQNNCILLCNKKVHQVVAMGTTTTEKGVFSCKGVHNSEKKMRDPTKQSLAKTGMNGYTCCPLVEYKRNISSKVPLCLFNTHMNLPSCTLKIQLHAHLIVQFALI